MKQFLMLVSFVLLVALLVPASGSAQVSLSYTTAISGTYANSEADTGTVAGQNVAGARLLSLVISCSDSMAADVYIFYKTNGTWTTKITDSLVTTSNTGTTKEYIIRSGAADNLAGIYFPVRVRVAGRASGNGVTSPTYWARWYYRP